MSRTRRLAVLAAVVVSIFATAATRAGSPSPSPSTSSSPPPPAPSETPAELPREELALEAWLDAPLPLDAAVGSTLHLGMLVWLRGPEEPLRGAGLRVLLYPATGSAESSFAFAHEDFTGHLVSDVEVPEGGVGELEILMPGTVCENDVCGSRDTPVPIRGVGPPPGVPLTTIAQAFIAPPTAALLVGQPSTFDIAVQPRIEWPAPGLVLPDAIWLQVRVPQGPIVDDIAARLADAAAGRYEADVTFDRTGELVVQAGTVEGAEGADLFSSSVRRVTVEAGQSATAAPDPSAGDAAALPGWAVPGLVALLAAGLALILLGRGRPGER